MILNEDCFRDVILYIESNCVYETVNGKKKMHEVSYNEILKTNSLIKFCEDDKRYIISKLFEGEYVTGYVIPKNNYLNYNMASIAGLTMKGHDMAANIKNETIWNETKSKLKGTAKVSLSILSQIVGETAASYSKRMIGLE